MIERVPFGRTGHRSSRVIFGAAGLGPVDQATVDELLPTLLEFGVNHIDVAPSYGKGNAEACLRPWMAEHRDKFFLATKTKGRTASEARATLEESLVRLGVDQVDLIQLHNLVEEDDWQTAHGPGGAVEAMVQAQRDGLARFIGVTGHGTRIAGMHLRSLERFDFDSVILPCNYSMFSFGSYREDAEQLLEVCQQRNIAAEAIKFAAVGRWEQSDHPTQVPDRRSWYETLDEPAAVQRAANFVLGRAMFLIASSDRSLLRMTCQAALDPGAVPTDAEMANDALAHGIRPLFDGAEFERA